MPSSDYHGAPFFEPPDSTVSTRRAGLPGARNHTRIHSADAHGELAGRAGGRLTCRIENETIVEAGDRGVQLGTAERSREQASFVVAEILRRQFPGAADGHPMPEGSLARGCENGAGKQSGHG